MNEEQIEAALRRLHTPDQPADLSARCLATLPTSSDDRHHRMKIKFPLFPLRPLVASFSLAAALLCAVIFSETHHPHDQNATRSRDTIAFADTIAATERMTHYHTTSWRTMLDWTASGELAATQTRVYREAWLDQSRGKLVTERIPRFSKLPATQRLNTILLLLPDGQAFFRDGSKVTLLAYRVNWHQRYQESSIN